MSADSRRLSEWLDLARKGDQEALGRITPLVYGELRRLASGYLRRERRDHTLQTTALVNEAYLRLAGQQGLSWKNRAHFLAIAATTMRRILVDYARAKATAKRGGSPQRIELEPAPGGDWRRSFDLDALDQALDRLAALDPQAARVVELRFFGGLTVEETAEALRVSAATVKREWAFARAWLRSALKSEGPECAGRA